MQLLFGRLLVLVGFVYDERLIAVRYLRNLRHRLCCDADTRGTSCGTGMYSYRRYGNEWHLHDAQSVLLKDELATHSAIWPCT